MESLEKVLLAKLSETNEVDTSHGLPHIKRVWKNVKVISLDYQKIDHISLMAATYLHDCVNVPKNHPDRKHASRLSAQAAVDYLKTIKFPSEKLTAVYHIIEAHSFTAQIEPQTVEAKILQDADRIDALGAIGIARCFYTAGRLGGDIYNGDQPFGALELDDRRFAVDHFYLKLLNLPSTMKTECGRELAMKRANVLQKFLENLKDEIAP